MRKIEAFFSEGGNAQKFASFFKRGGAFFRRGLLRANKEKPAAGAAAMPFDGFFPAVLPFNRALRRRASMGTREGQLRTRENCSSVVFRLLADGSCAVHPAQPWTLCPSGLRGWTQVPLAQAAWVQIPQVSFPRSLAQSFDFRCARVACKWQRHCDSSASQRRRQLRGSALPEAPRGRYKIHLARIELATFSV